jgi:hypothetical protein
MAFDDAFDCCEPDSKAREFGISVEALERHEQIVSKFHGETRSIVAYEIDIPAIIRRNAELDSGRCVAAGEFPCIVQQVFQDRAQQVLVALAFTYGR